MDRAERLEVLRAAFPVGTCGWCQRRARKTAQAMCPRCWSELEALGVATGYLAIDAPAESSRDVELERAEWILAHRPPPLLEIRRPPRRRRPRIGPPS